MSALGPKVVARQVDVLPAERGQMGQVLVGNRAARLGDRGQGGLQIGRVPQHDGAHHDVHGAGPVGLGLETVVMQASDALEEDGALQGVLGLALVQLARGASPLVRALDPAEREQGALDATDLAQRQREAVGAGIGAQAFEKQRGAEDAGADRSRHAQDVGPMAFDQALVDPAGDEGCDRRTGRLPREEMQPALADIGNARREAEAEQMAKREHMIGDAASIGVVIGDREIGGMMEEPVQDVRRLAGGGGDDLGVEGRIAVGDVGVEGDGRLRALVRVDLARRLGASVEREVLPVRTRGRTRTEPGREGKSMLRVDETAEGVTVGVLAQVPGRQPGQLPVAGEAARVRHAAQTEIGGICQHRGQDGARVVRRLACVEMGEGIGEAGPAVDLGEKVGDPDGGQASIKRRQRSFGLVGRDGLQRTDPHPPDGQNDVLQRLEIGLASDIGETPIEQRPPLVEPGQVGRRLRLRPLAYPAEAGAAMIVRGDQAIERRFLLGRAVADQPGMGGGSCAARQS